jgi:hypothetical protein
MIDKNYKNTIGGKNTKAKRMHCFGPKFNTKNYDVMGF